MLTYVKIGLLAAAVLGLFGFGWFVRDATCDAAEARAQLESEKTAHAATKLDLTAAKTAAMFANAAAGVMSAAASARQEIILELQNKPAAAGDGPRCNVGADGVKWLRRIGPD